MPTGNDRSAAQSLHGNEAAHHVAPRHEKNGVQFAMEAAGHASSKYIWRYVKPSHDQKEKALEHLF